MRTTYLNEQLYEGEYGVEAGKSFKVKSFDPNIFDPRDIFEIRNKLYVCKDIEYVLH
ncbi:hypothetical protein EZS27_014181 [termite gut metagenome]|uniref:Uncharacterized protein n=1 Tax=termite gut metagenome TaxID=433724 RepID=A0A5J4RWD8_9ZZZZ